MTFGAGRRWLSVVLRGVHLIAVIQYSAIVLYAVPDDQVPHAGIAVLMSGVLVWLLDLWYRPSHLMEGAGLSMLLKLLLLGGMLGVPSLRAPLFWIIVGWSALFSHAPASYRNAHFGRRRP